LDSVLGDSNPTYIKMDIEGAELDAISGGMKVLGRGRAIWAVCVYHKPADLWQLPLVLSQNSQGYSFFLRKHLKEFWDTVCYAIPQERLAV
jgi:hypothetical protein